MLDSTNSEPHMPDEHDDMPEVNVPRSAPVSRRGFGRHLLGASAVAVLVAMGKRDTAQAAPGTDPWRLGVNNSVNTDGSNFLGTINIAPLVFKTAQLAGSPVERMRITPSGNIGIGTTNPSAKLHAISGDTTTISGETSSTAANATAVLATMTSTTPGGNTVVVRGVNRGTNGNGAGVVGTHAGGGFGIHGISKTGPGAQGASTSGPGVKGVSTNSTGVRGEGPVGVQGQDTTTSGYGVIGYGGYTGVSASGNSYGVIAYSTSSAAVYANSSNWNGVEGYSASTTTSGVYGENFSTGGYGVAGRANGAGGIGVLGDTAEGTGVRGNAGGTAPNGVVGEATGTGLPFGVWGIASATDGGSAYAGYFNGNVHVSGTLSKASGSFKIDHPLARRTNTSRIRSSSRRI